MGGVQTVEGKRRKLAEGGRMGIERGRRRGRLDKGNRGRKKSRKKRSRRTGE